MILTLESHCHSCHSMDCGTSVESIITQCQTKKISAVIVCDHDVCGMTGADALLWENQGVRMLRAIEFTTREGVHIIGVCENITRLQQTAGYYTCSKIISALHSEKAWIIIPHPYHQTGLLGNKHLNEEEVGNVLKNAHFIEENNYKYGKTQAIERILQKYPNLKSMIGSDAHSAANIGAFVNRIEVTSMPMDILDSFYKSPVVYLKNKVHGKRYWTIKRIKKSKLYQLILNMFSPELRKRIKNKLINK